MYISYIDPGTGSMLISALIAMISVLFFMLKGFIYRTFNISSDKGDIVDLDKKYSLVFYSEGKQYWNVFQSTLEECSSRGIKATYMTSDKKDPGLHCEIDGIESVYIGKGRESYYVLNRLNADMVVMTTPGLDVLDIKRSENVKHYCHITHSMGSIGGYKSYSVDYFDSVLLGCSYDIEVIRGLEKLRGLKEKEIEVVGHTYVDSLRETLQAQEFEYDMFAKKRPTILLSPTWGNHGLLMNYGEELLAALEKENKYNVIVRPHPQTFISEKDMIDNLMNKFPQNDQRVWDLERENLKSMTHADLMISDFSGIIYDFYTLFRKPILTLNAHYERRGRDAMDVEGLPWDIQALDVIGKTINNEDIVNIIEIIEDTLENFNPNSDESTTVMQGIDTCPRESRKRTVDFIEANLAKIKEPEKINNESQHMINEATLVKDKNRSLKENIALLLKPTAMLQYLLSLLLFLAYSYIGLQLTPKKGLNYEFFTRVMPLTFYVGLVISIIFIISKKCIKDRDFIYLKKSEFMEKLDFLLILFPLTPIVQYILANQDILGLKSSVYVLVYYIVLSLLLIVLIPRFLSGLISKNMSTAIGLAFTFIFLNMSDFGRSTRPLYIASIFLAVFLLSFVLLFSHKKRILVLLASVLFVTNFLFGFKNISQVTQDIPEENGHENQLFSLFENREPQNKTNVYIMVYDAYPNEETMQAYEYDNSYQYNYLLDNGFTIYDGTYSLGASSIISMSSVMSLYNFPTTEQTRKMLAGEAFSYKLLRKIGYESEYLTKDDYMTKNQKTTHNFMFPSNRDSIDPHKIIINAINEGEFRFDLDFSSVTYDDYIRVKKERLERNKHKPIIHHSHDDNPGHSQNSGVLLPNETELFIERLEVANREMKNNISSIRENDSEAIIVILGDHGPYLTKNGIGLQDYEIDEIDRIDIQDRFGTFLAISWPDNDFVDQLDINLIQDVLPAIISYIYQDASLYDKLAMQRKIFNPSIIGGVDIVDGKLYGGQFNGDPLFDVKRVRRKN